MTARPPPHRPPTFSTAHYPPAHQDATRSSRQQHRPPPAAARLPPSSSSDEDMDAPLDLPTPQTMERPELGPEWSDDDTPPRQRGYQIPIDPSLLNEEGEPYDPPDVRRRRGRFDPVDDALRSQGHGGRAYPVARHPRPELTPDSPSSRGTHSPQAARNHAQASAGHSARSKGKGKAREGGQRGGMSDSESEDESSGGSPMTVDEEMRPAHPPPPQALNFNSNFYPAYDKNGGRIGLEHTRHGSRPAQGGGSYYLPRTRNYPTSNDDLPHVMELDFRVNPALIAPIHPSISPPLTGPDDPPKRGRGRPPGSTRAQRNVPVVREPSPSSVEEDTPSPHTSPVPLTWEDSTIDIPDPEPALRELLGFTADEEVSLRSLMEPPNGEKPSYSYPTLIKLAIYGSPNKRLTLQEIYQALIDRFQWFKDNADDKAWQGSIRHNLSLNKCFRKVPRPISEPGKGSFWVVDYSQGEGNKRQRKRNKKKTKAQREAEAKEKEEAEKERLAELAQRESDRQRGHISDDSPPGERSPLPVPAPKPTRPSASASGSYSAHGRAGAPQGGLPPNMWADKQNKGRLMHVLNTPDYMTIPVPPSTRATPEPHGRPASRASTIAAQLDDAHIDPPERGHVVGEGRTRQSTRPARASASPYQAPMDIRRRPRSRPRDSCEPNESSPPTRPQINPMWELPAFGQPSLRIAPTHWTPYGSPASAQLHRPAPGLPAFSGNSLGLSASAPAASSSEPRPRKPSAPNARGSSSRAGGSRAPNPPREGPRRSTRLSARRDDEYVDSHGTVYHSRGDNVESESEED